jgi:hypothetical protein
MMDPEQPSPQRAVPPVPPLSAAYPVNLEIPYPERSSRLWALGTILFLIPKIIALLPHLIVMYVLSYVLLIAVAIAHVAILFTGRFPRSFFNFIVGFYRWQVRVNSFLFGLTDAYPPFRLKR